MKFAYFRIALIAVLLLVGGTVAATCYTDCSHFVNKAYTDAGCSSPGGTSSEIYGKGDSDKSNLKKGDLIVYPGHVVMCTDDGCGNIIHAKGRKYGIVENNSSYYVGRSDSRVVRASKLCSGC